MFCLTITIHRPSRKFPSASNTWMAGLPRSQIRCVQGKRIVRCTSQRLKSEIPIEGVHPVESVRSGQKPKRRIIMDAKRNRAWAPLARPEAGRGARHYFLLSVSAGIIIAAVVALVISGSRRTSAATPSPAYTMEVPKFVVDPSWPHIPNGWTLGQVSSAAADADGNIWIIHRSRTVKPGVKTGPPVMEFDPAG